MRSPLGILVVAEVRKVVTTRSSRAVLIGMATLGGVFAGLAAALPPGETVAVGPALVALGLVFALAIPLVGILVMTSDWQSRDIAALFLAHPRRGVVFWAKASAAVLASVGLLITAPVVAVVIAGVAAISTGRTLDWGAAASGLALISTVTGVGVALGIALGAAIQHATAAIVLSFLQTLILEPALSAIPVDAVRHVRPGAISDFLLGEGGLGAALGGAFVWVVLPLVIGYVRHMRREVA